VGDVRLGSRLADHEPLADLAVREAQAIRSSTSRSRGVNWEMPWQGGRNRGRCRVELLDHRTRDRRREQRLSMETMRTAARISSAPRPEHEAAGAGAHAS